MAGADIKFTYSLEGAKDLIEKLKSMAGHVREASTEAVEDGSSIVVDRIKSLAPVASKDYPHVPPGWLRDAIDQSPPQQGKTTVSVFVGINPKSHYPDRPSKKLTKTGRLRKRAGKVSRMVKGPWTIFIGHLIEFGTSKMAARPFVRPGFKGSERTAFEKIVAVLRGWLMSFTK
jgi:HK97 gp10 family phage protein